MNRNHFIIPALIISLAAIIATTILAITVKNIKSEDQSINTTGSAKKVIVSDLGILRGTLSVEAASPKEAYQKLQVEKRSEEHTSELQSLMRISYAVFCLKKKKKTIP